MAYSADVMRAAEMLLYVASSPDAVAEARQDVAEMGVDAHTADLVIFMIRQGQTILSEKSPDELRFFQRRMGWRRREGATQHGC